MSVTVNTIGFTKTTAEYFFQRLQENEVRCLVDVRLNNTSQLAGFAKAEDLKFFLKSICNSDYIHMPILAPTEDMFRKFKKEKGEWSVFRRDFLNLMESRRVESQVSKDLLDDGCLLCSEAEPHHCHRSLVCEYLNGKWGASLDVRHL